MPNTSITGNNTILQLRSIELLDSSLRLPPTQDDQLSSFVFNIRIESKADANKKEVYIVVHVDIGCESQTLVLGAISVSCIFHIEHLETIISTSPNGNLEIPESLLNTLNAVALSTTRGVMFATFKGTVLHHAILPLID